VFFFSPPIDRALVPNGTTNPDSLAYANGTLLLESIEGPRSSVSSSVIPYTAQHDLAAITEFSLSPGLKIGSLQGGPEKYEFSLEIPEPGSVEGIVE
jgi:hypothetical protein